MELDNSQNRLQDVFFYGLYMDPDILKDKDVKPRNPRIGVVRGYRLCVGKFATLLRVEDSEAYGILYSLTHEEISKLYWGAGLTAYVSEALLVETADKHIIPALCCNLLVPPAGNEGNPEYTSKLMACMRKYGVPTPDA